LEELERKRNTPFSNSVNEKYKKKIEKIISKKGIVANYFGEFLQNVFR